MDATLVDSRQQRVCSDRQAELSALVVALRQQMEELRREVGELRQQMSYWKSMHARAVQKNEKLQEEIDTPVHRPTES